MDRADRRARLRERLEAKYPDLVLTDIQLDNYLDAQDRMRGRPIAVLPSIGLIDVQPVTPDRVEDVLDFFDYRAFADNAGWASCYCVFHHLEPETDPGWPERRWQQNREELRRRLEDGETRGFVAYDGDQVVGWLNASDRSAFPEHRTSDDEGVASVVCFMVAPTHRGHGIGAQLLDSALGHLARAGVTAVEAYPVPDDATDASAYKGRANLFTEAGFEQVEDDSSPRVLRRM